MNYRETYSPGPADMAHIEKNGEDWTLVLVKHLRHAPEKVWKALTDPAQLSEWAPFDSDVNLGVTGVTANLTTVGAPGNPAAQTTVIRADAPKLLEYNWGEHEMRWQLEATDPGTQLTLWTKIPRPFIAMGAAGWQLCFDVLESNLDEKPIGRMVGMEIMKFEGWQRLNKEYMEKFGIEAPKW